MTKRNKRGAFDGSTFLRSTLIAGLMFVTPVNAMALDSTIENDVDALVQQFDSKLGVLPGFSIAIIDNGAVILEKAYGVAEIEANRPFLTTTSSYVASATKAFFGLTIAQLVERGELDLDAPVGATYLSDMEQSSLGLLGSTTFRKLLTHTHGLDFSGVSDRVSLIGDYTDEEIWSALKSAKPLEDGEVFDYSNTGYIAASFILEHVYNDDWKKIVEREVFVPLGMNHTVSKVSDLLETDIAVPYVWFGSSLRMPIYKRDDTMHAAGGHYSTISDLSRWLIANMNEGRVDGEQKISSAAIQMIQQPMAPVEGRFYEFNRNAYGLGWYHADYEGKNLMHHFGSLTGYRTHISMMPEIGIGVAIMANDFSRPTGYLPDMVASMIYDIALEKQGVEEKYTAKVDEIAEMIAPYVGRTMPARPRNAPNDEVTFLGTYQNSNLGDWELRYDGDDIRLFWGNLESDLSYRQQDGNSYVRVELAGDGILVKLVRNDEGALTGFDYRGSIFTKMN